MKKLTLMSLVVLSAAAGCQQDTSTKKTTGSYTAIRHHQTGSNIPQPYSAESASQAYDPEQFANTQVQQTNLSGRASSGGGR